MHTEMKKPSNRGQRRKFTQQFKDDAVRMIIVDGRSVTDVAESLGVQRSCVDRWRNAFLRRSNACDLGDQNDSAMTPMEMEAEMRQLRKRLRETEMEREILKKALSIFSQENRSGRSS